MALVRPSACFAGTRLEAFQVLGYYTRIEAVLAVPGSRVHAHCAAKGMALELVDLKDRKRSFDFLAGQQTDLVLSAGFPFILPQWVLQARPRFINSHPALLPAYKGNNAIKDAYAAGEEFMGVTVHHMIAEVDAGAPIAQERIWVKGLPLPEIYQLLFGAAEPLAVARALERLLGSAEDGGKS